MARFEAKHRVALFRTGSVVPPFVRLDTPTALSSADDYVLLLVLVLVLLLLVVAVGLNKPHPPIFLRTTPLGNYLYLPIYPLENANAFLQSRLIFFPRHATKEPLLFPLALSNIRINLKTKREERRKKYFRSLIIEY